MEHANVQHKRAIRRFPLQLPVTVTAQSGELVQATAESRDVSSHGICFYCDAALAPESAIEFTVTLPSEITMTDPISVRCAGTVVRVEEGDGPGKFAVAAAISNYDFLSDDEAREMAARADAPPVV
jgi:hypothetical protein